MSAAAATADLPPPSRSGRLLSLVRKLIDCGRQLAATLRECAAPNDTTDLKRRFGTASLPLILARIALGLHRARLLEERIVRTAPRLDAEPGPKPARRTPHALPCKVQPPSPRQDAGTRLANL